MCFYLNHKFTTRYINLATLNLSQSRSMLFWTKQSLQQGKRYVGSTAGKFKKLQTKPKYSKHTKCFLKYVRTQFQEHAL